MYYVYEWYEINTGEIFYVGKGCGERYKCKKRNRKFNEYIKSHECESRIIKYFEDEKEAFEYEYERIEELRSIGQCGCNVMNGGRGGTVECWSDEAREYYSEHNIMKEKGQRDRMSKLNPMKNKETAMRVNSKKRRAVIIGDRRFDSVKAAKLEYGICWDVLNTWCKKGINPYGEKCRYEDSQQAEYNNKRYNIGISNAIIYNGIRYECEKDLADECGVSKSTITRWVKKGHDKNGNKCVLEKDDRPNKNDSNVNEKKNRVKPVIINGVEYKSCYAASKELNIPSSTLYSYLYGVRTSTEYICKYGNQQPS